MEDFKTVYEKYYKKIFIFLYKLSGNETQAEELTQQTLYKAYLNIEKFEERCSLYTWLCAIGKNEWLSEGRKAKHIAKECPSKRMSREDSQDLQKADAYNLEEDVLARYTLRMFRQELQSLPEPYRNVVILRIYAEISFKEIAAQYAKSESWARVMYFRGKNMLEERMEKYR